MDKEKIQMIREDLKKKKVRGCLSKPAFSGARFVIVSSQRSGSNWLTDLLNSHPDIATYTELFLKQGEGVPDWGKYKDVVYWQTYRRKLKPGLKRRIRLIALFQYINNVFVQHPEKAAVGFKLMYSQIVKLPETLLFMRVHRMHIVHLIRYNTLDMILSGLTMKLRKVAHVRKGSSVKKVRVRVEPSWLIRELVKRERHKRWFSHLFRCMGVPYLEITYEDIVADRSVLNSCLKFLGCLAVPLTSDFKKLNPVFHPDLIENYRDVEGALLQTSFATLLRS